MGIKRVSYYEITCDQPRCGVTLNDLNEFAAFSDEGTAMDVWIDSDGVITDTDKCYCPNHSEPHVCVDCLDGFDELDENRRCKDCVADLAEVENYDREHAE